MSLKEHLTAPSSPYSTRCTVAKILTTLPKDDHGLLSAALANDEFLASQIGRALRMEGHKVRDDSVRRHRRGECNCVA